jgi:hypothetical protein
MHSCIVPVCTPRLDQLNARNFRILICQVSQEKMRVARLLCQHFCIDQVYVAAMPPLVWPLDQILLSVVSALLEAVCIQYVSSLCLWECCWWFWTGLLWMDLRHIGTFSYKCSVSKSLGHKFMFCESCKIQYTGLGWLEFRSGKWYLNHWWVVWRCLQLCKAPQSSPLFVASLLNHSCALYGLLTLLRFFTVPLMWHCFWKMYYTVYIVVRCISILAELWPFLSGPSARLMVV